MNDRFMALPQRGESQCAGSILRERAAVELCIPIVEDMGYAHWFWFSGRSLSATVHWWVHQGGLELPGQVLGTGDDDAHCFHKELLDDRLRPAVYEDYDWATFMALPVPFRASVIPRFARNTAELGDCQYGKNTGLTYCLERIRKEDTVAKWLISEVVAAQVGPEEFLVELRLAFSRGVATGLFAYWLKRYLQHLGTQQPTDGLA